MVESALEGWRPIGVFDDCAFAGRHGRDDGPAGVAIRVLTRRRLATLIAAEGREAALAEALVARFGLPLPAAGRAEFSGEAGLVWAAPSQYLLVLPDLRPLGELVEALAGVAAVTDQSEARGLLAVTGPKAREALSKGVSIDLHPSVFGSGAAASTSLAHVAIQLWLRDAAPTYILGAPRSFAGSVWSWLAEACAGYGYEVVSDPDARRR